MSTDKGKPSSWLPVLGWIVAVISLWLNWQNFNIQQQEKELKAKETPKYSYELATFDLKSLPQELLKSDSLVRHSFSVTHKTGKPVRDLAIIFRTSAARIDSIVIDEGKSGTDSKIEANGKEAQLKKEQLLPGEIVRGYVLTKGVDSVVLSISAKDGELASSSSPVIPQLPWYESEEVLIPVLLGLGGLVILIFAYGATMLLEHLEVLPATFGPQLATFLSSLNAKPKRWKNVSLIVAVSIVLVVSAQLNILPLSLFQMLLLGLLLAVYRRLAILTSRKVVPLAPQAGSGSVSGRADGSSP